MAPAAQAAKPKAELLWDAGAWEAAVFVANLVSFPTLRVQVPPEKGFTPQKPPKVPPQKVFGPLGLVKKVLTVWF